MKTLDGINVLITRPRAQAEPWADKLAERGARPLVVPLMELQKLSTPAERQAIKTCILDFDLYQKAIFVSQNAVAYALEWLSDYWPQLPMGIEYFGVGERTAAALAAEGISVTALQSQGAMNSEALLDAPQLQAEAVREQRIVIFRGQGGRGVLGETLSGRGARVDYCELYRRQCPAGAAEDLNAVLSSGPAISGALVAVLHSGETLDNYARTLGELTPDNARRLQRAPILVPGERVTAQAQALGFKQVITAENATDPSMLAALETAASRNLFSD